MQHPSSDNGSRVLGTPAPLLEIPQMFHYFQCVAYFSLSQYAFEPDDP